MTERWKPWKAKGRLSTRSHRSLEISPTPRDFHIPTAQAGRGWKTWKTKTRFPTFPRGARDDYHESLFKLQKPRKEVGRCAASPSRFS